MTALWSDIAVPAFATLFVIVDPFGLVPMFMAMTAHMSEQARRLIAFRAVLFAFCVLLSFAWAGQSLLNFLGISLPAFRIAGGILLFMTALEMLFEKRTERRNKNAARAADQSHHHETVLDDIWVFPLGTPLIAGPGAITSIILLMGNDSAGLAGRLVVSGVLFSVMGLSLVLFLIAGKLGKYVNPTASRAMTRILGIILAALAVQFVLTGLTTAGFGVRS